MNYYNEIDPKAAAWVSELIRAGLIPDGFVDTRSIAEVQPKDLHGYDQCHFFAGIAGWPLALQLAGWTGPVWTGSCPCQPFSTAGRQRGAADERHLWPEFYRLIAECHPPTVFGEQVASKLGREWLSGVRSDLEGVGYAVGAADLCAAGVGAPHIRQRLYWVAHHHPGLQVGQADEQRPGEVPTAIPRCDAGGVAESYGGQLRRESVIARGEFYGEAPGRKQDDSVFERGGSVGGVGNPELHGCVTESIRRGLGEGEGEGRMLERERPSPDWVEHPQSDGWFEWGPEPNRGITTGGRFWDPSDIVPCRDGKTRRIEPGTFPLAHGIPGRVGLLRGYGNAIVPQVAAEFVQAFMTL